MCGMVFFGVVDVRGQMFGFGLELGFRVRGRCPAFCCCSFLSSQLVRRKVDGYRSSIRSKLNTGLSPSRQCGPSVRKSARMFISFE